MSCPESALIVHDCWECHELLFAEDARVGLTFGRTFTVSGVARSVSSV